MKYQVIMENKIKNSILEIDTNFLTDFKDFEKVNDDWNVEKYLNFSYDINAAIAFSKLYFPTFIEYRGCIVLESRFDEGVFEDWYKEFNGEIKQIEKMCNLYELKDLFHINSPNQSIGKIKELGKSLKISWEQNLKILFPNKDIEVSLIDENDSCYITINSRK
ncbi:hypothetical protein HN014_01150 [Aquimarina sp. TRL1]|uniref:hypothetical protein n=1 Tax=Aquimarina sp. (strain TRL1) TaxID=2736252 RepID=UPI00158AA520|nr:hypothetical protein [Aquimarina sp. TRL1]QKX03576.1 hypothetical protein HN014_01150 [Aquimarina sp. TRL1]